MNGLGNRIAKVGKHLANRMGVEVVRLRNSPRHTWLALGRLPIRTVIDVGANRGRFAAAALARFPGARIHAIEPLPGPFGELCEWAAAHGDAVSTYQIAASDRSGSVDMHEHVRHTSSSSVLPATALNRRLHPLTAHEQMVTVRSDLLDRVLANVTLEPGVLVKLDVQGFEDRVIRGASEVLLQACAVITEVGIDQLYDGQATFDGVYRELEGRGFAYVGNLDQEYADDGRVVSLDAVFLRGRCGADRGRGR